MPRAVCQVDMMDRSAPAAGGGADGNDAASAQLNSGASIGVRLSGHSLRRMGHSGAPL